jgi:hypothetical protein
MNVKYEVVWYDSDGRQTWWPPDLVAARPQPSDCRECADRGDSGRKEEREDKRGGSMKRRPKHTCIDKPRGFTKKMLKRWARRMIKEELQKEFSS